VYEKKFHFVANYSKRMLMTFEMQIFILLKNSTRFTAGGEGGEE
jgi:hypothetical protein